MRLALFVACLLTIQHATSGEEASKATFVELVTLAFIRFEFQLLFRSEPKRIPKFVQMGFHVCIGGCDGCLNLNHPANSALASHYEHMRYMYRKWQRFLSLADYAVISGMEAVKAGIAADTSGCDDGPCSISLPFTSGRVTCPDPKNPPTNVDFPFGQDETAPQEFLAEPFGLTQKEMVALLGCHSLGRAHRSVSGFSGPWDNTPRVLDNGYYKALSQVEWSQNYMEFAGANQWNGRTDSGNKLMMLHADMILQHKFTVSGDDDVANCTSSSECPLNAGTSPFVFEFAKDKREFLDTLGVAYTKMCDTATFDTSKQRQFN